MASRRVALNRAEHARYKEDVEHEGKPFHPFAMFHDTVMSFVVVSVIIGLACVWYFTSGEDPEDVGWLGPRYTEAADPGTTSFVPRPDWFFYFLFYLLRIFKWPETVVIGTVGIPTIAIILLLALPFLDLRNERRLLRRPVALVALILTVISMGVLTYKGATAEGGRRRGGGGRWCRSGPRSRASRTTRRRSRAPSSSPSPAASTATRTSAPALRTSVRPS